MTKVTHCGKEFDVQLPALTQPLITLMTSSGKPTQLLDPIDCLRLGVLNGGYFYSDRSDQVHSIARNDYGTEVLDLHFSFDEQLLLPSYYSKAKTVNGCRLRNYFGVTASSSYEQWAANGWVHAEAPEGWFESYVQAVQLPAMLPHWPSELKRQSSFVSRHAGQLTANCPGDLTKRRKQRQALLNWASPLAFL